MRIPRSPASKGRGKSKGIETAKWKIRGQRQVTEDAKGFGRSRRRQRLALWLVPVIPALWEPEVGRSFEVRTLRQAWPTW